MDCSRIARSCCACLAVLAFVSIAAPAGAELPPATSSRKVRDQAEKAIPWRDLAQSEQRMVRYLTRNASIYRRLPTRVVDCDPQLFNFLAQHPEVVTDVWQLMGVGALSVKPADNGGYVASDSTGTKGALRYLVEKYSDDARNTLLIYGEGNYTGAPLPRAVKAKCLMLVRSGSSVETNGRTYVTAVVDTWVVVERAGAELIAKTLQPVMAQAADHNFTETMKFVSTFSRTAEDNPSGMQRLSQKLPSIDAATREELVAICQQTHDRNAALTAKREAARLARANRSTTN